MTHMHVETIKLWASAPPAALSGSVAEPTLEIYRLPGELARGAVLVCPGGGYGRRAPHEQAPIAQRYNAAGFHAFVLQYRVAPHRHPAPLLDAARALRLIRSNAGRWHVQPDQVAVCGFSAGGHLAASLGVHFDLAVLDQEDPLDALSCCPDALILAYPVITSGPLAHRGSFENLLGPDPDTAALTLMSLEKQVTSETPPTFLWHTAEDASVPVENSLLFAAALSQHRVPFELHVYTRGAHGLGLAESQPRAASWMGLSISWLEEQGWSGGQNGH